MSSRIGIVQAIFLQLFVESSALVLMEQGYTSLPPKWSRGARTPRNKQVELIFAVKQRGLNELHDALMRVSDPSSADYGKHLSNEQVNALTAPDPRDVDTVMAFLKSRGAEAEAATPNTDMISTTVSVGLAEELLAATYYHVTHDSGVEVSRAVDGYSLPRGVAAAVDFVSPTVHVPGVRRPAFPLGISNASSPADDDDNTPKNLRQLYSVGDAKGKADGNKQAVTAFLENGYDDDSLKQFWKTYCDDITCGRGAVKLVGDATTAMGQPGIESMLDIESITGVAGNIESEFWGFGGRAPGSRDNEPYMKWLAKLSSTSDADVPKIFSTSYGEDESSWSYPAAQRLNVEFQKAGVRGISLLYASGDEGANCKDGTFVPEGPGSSPYVTTVGGTTPGDSFPKPGSETAIGLSSGGFSSYWPMPDYQKDAVAAYLKQEGLPPASRGYNTSGRAYPDLAAQASNFIVVAGIPLHDVSGTSAATPVVSGLFSLLNDVRLQNGKSTLGFLNPLIYQHASAFHDITEGASTGCDEGDGWPATKGWDAVTGVGTPDYSKLVAAVANLPSGHQVTDVVV